MHMAVYIMNKKDVLDNRCEKDTKAIQIAKKVSSSCFIFKAIQT